MVEQILDHIRSLAALMDEETEALGRRGRFPEHRELAAAKLRLASALEVGVARMDREQPGWLDALGETDRDTLFEALDALREASGRNAGMLRRQMELADELMGAVTREIRRLTGSTSTVYTAAGRMARSDLAASVSINSAF